MNVLRLFLMAVAAIVGGVTFGAGYAFAAHGHWIIAAVIAVIGLPIAWLVYQQSRTYTVRSSELQKEQLEVTVKQLAAANNGVVPMSAVMKATAFSKDRAEQEMRGLIGKGICEMDFSENGEMLFRLTPMDEARASLAAMSEKPREKA